MSDTYLVLAWPTLWQQPTRLRRQFAYPNRPRSRWEIIDRNTTNSKYLAKEKSVEKSLIETRQISNILRRKSKPWHACPALVIVLHTHQPASLRLKNYSLPRLFYFSKFLQGHCWERFWYEQCGIYDDQYEVWPTIVNRSVADMSGSLLRGWACSVDPLARGSSSTIRSPSSSV